MRPVGGPGRCDWRTSQRLLAPARNVIGGQIDCDPATATDNPTQARTFYTEADNGLELSWDGFDSILLNPPWSKKLKMPIEPWLVKALETAANNPIADIFVVTPASTNAGWFHRSLVQAPAHCFPKGRVEYDRAPGEDPSGSGVGFDTCVTYFGLQIDAFIREFSQVGWVPEQEKRTWQ